jgi:hypothetical protein
MTRLAAISSMSLRQKKQRHNTAVRCALTFAE